jgi:hypothetical protein
MDADDAADGDEGKKAEGEPGDGAAIDIAALAERVYRLMCRELRLERARGASMFGNRRF